MNVCDFCGEPLAPDRANDDFCSAACADAFDEDRADGEP